MPVRYLMQLVASDLSQYLLGVGDISRFNSLDEDSRLAHCEAGG